MVDAALGIPFFLLAGLTIVLAAVGVSLALAGLSGKLSSRLLCREAERMLRAAAAARASDQDS